MPMSEFEQLANDIAIGMGTAECRIEDYGYSVNKQEALSCIKASVIIWLVASEERRLGGNFKETVIDRLPDEDDENWEVYLHPAPASTLKERMQAVWGIRIAFTHAAGVISEITNAQNRNWADNSGCHIRGIIVDNGFLDCSRLNTHQVIRSIVQVRDVLT